MVIPEEREGRMDDDPNLSRDTTPANATVNIHSNMLFRLYCILSCSYTLSHFLENIKSSNEIYRKFKKHGGGRK
jgi:hypothetical protein